jgi:hypothetical protein
MRSITLAFPFSKTSLSIPSFFDCDILPFCFKISCWRHDTQYNDIWHSENEILKLSSYCLVLIDVALLC